MTYYINTTQTPNILFDVLLKHITFSELKVLMTIIRKTIGMVNPNNIKERVERAWISQKLFMLCTSLSGRAVSSAIDSLVKRQLIEVTDYIGNILETKEKRRGVSRLYYASRLRLEPNPKQASEVSCHNPVNKGHTIKLNNKTKSCYNSSQGIKRISDTERYQQILGTLNS